jgi:hypothetical protein
VVAEAAPAVVMASRPPLLRSVVANGEPLSSYYFVCDRLMYFKSGGARLRARRPARSKILPGSTRSMRVRPRPQELAENELSAVLERQVMSGL